MRSPGTVQQRRQVEVGGSVHPVVEMFGGDAALTAMLRATRVPERVPLVVDRAAAWEHRDVRPDEVSAAALRRPPRRLGLADGDRAGRAVGRDRA
jgi:hypothetical protein